MDDFINNPQDHINFYGKDWSILRAYLKYKQDIIMDSLCRDLSQEETNVLRGNLRGIRDILSLEQAAPKGRPQE